MYHCNIVNVCCDKLIMKKNILPLFCWKKIFCLLKCKHFFILLQYQLTRAPPPQNQITSPLLSCCHENILQCNSNLLKFYHVYHCIHAYLILYVATTNLMKLLQEWFYSISISRRLHSHRDPFVDGQVLLQNSVRVQTIIIGMLIYVLI